MNAIEGQDFLTEGIIDHAQISFGSGVVRYEIPTVIIR